MSLSKLRLEEQEACATKAFRNHEMDIDAILALAELLGIPIDGTLRELLNVIKNMMEILSFGIVRPGNNKESNNLPMVIPPELITKYLDAFKANPNYSELYAVLCNGSTTPNMLKKILNLIENKHKKNKTDDTFTHAEIMNDFLKLLVQFKTPYTMMKRFQDLTRQHCHGPNNEKESCTCSFHQESLLLHLLRSMLMAYKYSQDENPISEDQCYLDNDENTLTTLTTGFKNLVLICFTALNHDIGKPPTRIVSSKNNFTGFPLHEIISAIMVESMLGRGNYPFNNEDIRFICDVIALHMCGFAKTPTPHRLMMIATQLKAYDEEYRKRLIDGLCIMAKADKAGAIPYEGYESKTICADDSDFRENLLSCINDENHLQNMIDEKQFVGLMLLMNGRSGDGKTTYAKAVLSYCKLHDIPCELFNRDDFICQFASRKLGSEVSYSDAREYVYANELEKNVDSEMKNKIDNAIKQGVICIIDTMKIYYGHFKVEDNIARMMVHFYNPNGVTEEDATRHHENFKAQVQSAGETSPSDPCPRKGIMNGARREMCLASGNENGSVVGQASEVRRPNADATNTTFNSLEFVTGFLKLWSKCKPYKSPVDDMTLHELIEYLLEKFESIEDIKNWFGERNYSVRSPNMRENRLVRIVLMKKFGIEQCIKFNGNEKEKEEEEEEAMNAYDKMNKDELLKKLDELNFNINHSIILKYREGINRDFYAPWHIESRSTIILFYEDRTFDIIPVMHRGPEVLGKETQDMKGFDTSSFSQQLNEIVSRLNGIHIDGIDMNRVNDEIIITSKTDGSCMRVVRVKAGTPYDDLLKKIQDASRDVLGKAFTEAAKKVTTEYAFYLWTNGTMGTGSEEMQAYIVASLVYSDVEKSSLLKLIEEGKTPLEVSTHFNDSTLFERFVCKIMEINGKHHEKMTYFFEMVLPDRKNPFTNCVHGELAISYDDGGISYLSCAYHEEGALRCIPHCLQTHSFTEPLYWITTIDRALEMVNASCKVCVGNMTETEFFTHFSPTGGCGSFDPEGFIGYFATDTTEMIYVKIKTPLYYDLHKIRSEKLSYLRTLNECAGKYFPAFRMLLSFFNVDNVTKFIKQLMELATCDAMKATLNAGALISYEKLKKVFETTTDTDTDTKKRNQIKKQLDTRIIGGANPQTWNTLVCDLMTKQYGRIDEKNREFVGGYAKKLILEKLNAFDPTINLEKNIADLVDPKNISMSGPLNELFASFIL
jgi:hypothetical protein